MDRLLLVSPSLSTSTPESTCCCTVYLTADATATWNCSASTGTPASCANRIGRNSFARAAAAQRCSKEP